MICQSTADKFKILRDKILEKQYKHLNKEQREAVLSTNSSLLILAGAGSGKTTVLTNRIAHLIRYGEVYKSDYVPQDLVEEDVKLMEQYLAGEKEILPPRLASILGRKGIYPNNILAITFTNKAAREMKERLELLLGLNVDSLWVSTFHSACVRILRKEIGLLGYNSNFVIYDDADQKTLLKMILKDLNLDDKKYTPGSLKNRISAYKNELKSPSDAERLAENYYDEIVVQVYKEYQKRLQANNATDFDDLILLVVRLFQQNPAVLEKYQQKFKYVLVDEYQDTNTCQYMFINLLAKKHQNICVVGDDDQSIYGWRGADISNILNFEKDYEQTTVIKLEQNYRSTQIILDAANEVISNNTERKEKNLWTEKEGGDKVVLYTAHDEIAESNYICRQVKTLIADHNKKYKDFAVLCRTTGQFRVIEEGLMRNNIPYRIFGGTKFYDRKEIKDILAYLRVIVNSSDTISLRRVINTPKRGIGVTTWEKLINYAQKESKSLYDALDNPEQAGLGTRAINAVKGFRQMMEDFKELSQKKTVTQLTEYILEESGYVQELQADQTVEGATRLENLQEFMSGTLDYDNRNPGGDLATYLAEISLVTDIDNYQETDDALVVMTMHGAKGLEFPVVFISGMEEGIFPHIRSINSGKKEELEEERRLCYVAITRAKEKLFLTNAFHRTLYGRQSVNQPSRFIEEIPDEYIDNTQRKNRKKAFNILKQKPELDTTFVVGDKVEHKKWGTGVIVSVSGSGEDVEVSVAFPDLGIKNLITKYAPIVKITS